MSANQPTCGRCGVYRHLHPTKNCAKPRLSFWWDRHLLLKHLTVPAWVHLIPSSLRWKILAHYNDNARRDICWCDLTNSGVYADGWSDAALEGGRVTTRGYGRDYKGPDGCACDFPMPWEASAPRPGWCYCAPVTEGV